MSFIENFSIENIDPGLIHATKSKLRHWIVDQAGLCPNSLWKALLTETASDIRRCAAKSAPIVAVPPVQSARTELWNWIVEHAGALPLPAITLLPWAIALEEVATEIP